MIDTIVNLVNDGNIEELKKLIKENYDEIGEMVYGLCLSINDIEDEDSKTIVKGIIFALLENGHKLDYVDANGNSALLAAINSQDESLVIAFNASDSLFVKANNDKITPVALSYTLENENIKLISTMKLGMHVNDVFPVNGEDMTYFALAILTSTAAICKAIALNENFDFEVHKPYLTDIEWDDSEDDLEKQELIKMLENGGKFELEDSEEYVAGEEDSELERMHQGLSPLLHALATNNDEEAKSLIESGAKINYRNTAGFTPLMMAVMMNNYDMAKYLIERGAFLNSKIYNGLTPILKAYLAENEEIFDLLLENDVYIDENTYNGLTNMVNKSKIQERLTEKIKKYKNPIQRKQKYPYEYMYELGYNETYDGDGYHEIQDVFSEEYGSNMINSHDYLQPFGMCPINHSEHKESGNGLMTRGPSQDYKGMKFAILFKDGKVEKYGNGEDEKSIIFKDYNIIQIDSTNYSIIGLTDDGKVLIDNNKLKELDVVSTWTNIKKIAAGNSSVYAITNDGEFKYAVSKMDKPLIGAALDHIVEDIKKNNFKLTDISARNFNLGFVTEDGRVRGVGNSMIGPESGLINDISDAVGISVNNHTVVLRKDKTLLAFGNNDFNQCNIAKWHDIERIQATYFNTVGYATNGEMLCTDCMFKRINSDMPFFDSALRSEGFGNVISMGTFVPDAIRLDAKEGK